MIYKHKYIKYKSKFLKLKEQSRNNIDLKYNNMQLVGGNYEIISEVLPELLKLIDINDDSIQMLTKLALKLKSDAKYIPILKKHMEIIKNSVNPIELSLFLCSEQMEQYVAYNNSNNDYYFNEYIIKNGYIYTSKKKNNYLCILKTLNELIKSNTIDRLYQNMEVLSIMDNIEDKINFIIFICSDDASIIYNYINIYTEEIDTLDTEKIIKKIFLLIKIIKKKDHRIIPDIGRYTKKIIISNDSIDTMLNYLNSDNFRTINNINEDLNLNSKIDITELNKIAEFFKSDIGVYIIEKLPKLLYPEYLLPFNSSKLYAFENLIEFLNSDIGIFTHKMIPELLETKYLIPINSSKVFDLYTLGKFIKSEYWEFIKENIPYLLDIQYLLPFNFNKLSNLIKIVMLIKTNFNYNIGLIKEIEDDSDIKIELVELILLNNTIATDTFYNGNYYQNYEIISTLPLYNTKSFIITNEFKNKWLCSQCSPNAKLLGKFLLDITRHVSYSEFQFKLLESIQKLPIENIYVIVVYSESKIENKSNLWVTSMFIDQINKLNLKINIFDIIYTTCDNFEEKIHYYKRNTNIINYIICDDGSYSGQQLYSYVIPSIKDSYEFSEYKIYCIIPFISNNAKQLILSNHTNVILLNSDIIETVRERCNSLNILRIKYKDEDGDLLTLRINKDEDYAKLSKLLDKYFPNLDKTIEPYGVKNYDFNYGSMPIYFDHKISDYLSSFPIIYQYGYVKKEVGCSNANSLLFDNCDEPTFTSSLCIIPYYKQFKIQIMRNGILIK